MWVKCKHWLLLLAPRHAGQPCTLQLLFIWPQSLKGLLSKEFSQCFLYNWTFPVGLGANYYTYKMNKLGGKVLSVRGFKFVSLLVDSSGKSSLMAQPMTLRHNTGGTQWKRGNYAWGGKCNNHPHICEIKQTPMMLVCSMSSSFVRYSVEISVTWRLQQPQALTCSLCVVLRELRAGMCTGSG